MKNFRDHAKPITTDSRPLLIRLFKAMPPRKMATPGAHVPAYLQKQAI